MNTFRTVNINVKSNPLMNQARVRHDVRRAAQQGGLIGWQEISPRRYFEAIRNLGPDWGHYMPRDGKLRIPTPISWKKSIWEKQDAGFVKTHGGRAKVSPNRYITWVKLKHKATGKQIVRINTHLVSGAWSSPKPTTEWRRAMWREHMKDLRNVVERFEKKGMNVIIGGDFNRDSYKLFGNDVAYDNKLNVGTHGKSTLDYLMHTKSSELRRVGGRVQGGYASDHDAVIARYKLTGAGKSAPQPQSQPQPQPTSNKGSTFKVATVNDDFTDNKTNLRRVRKRADVMLVQEAKNTNIRGLFGKKIGVHQNVGRDDKAGSAVVWRRNAADAGARGYDLAVRPHGREMLNRWISYTDMTIDGQTVRMASVHRPPARFKALWPLFDARLAAFAKNSPVPLIIGMDANERTPTELAKKTGLRWKAPPGSIDGFLVSPGIAVEKMWRLQKGTSDHHPVMAKFRLAK